MSTFELWCWRRLLGVPWTARRSNQSILKEISPGCSLEGLMLKLKLQYFGHLMQRVDSLEKTLMLEGLGVGGERDDRGWDGWMASLTQWKWIWVNSRSWWWTGRPGVLRFMGSQRVGHDWATELSWTNPVFPTPFIEETVLFPLYILGFLQINWLCMHRFLSELSTLFHCSICLFLYLYHIVLITIALLYINSLKSGWMVLQLWFSFSRLLWLFRVLWIPYKVPFSFVLFLVSYHCSQKICLIRFQYSCLLRFILRQIYLF